MYIFIAKKYTFEKLQPELVLCLGLTKPPSILTIPYEVWKYRRRYTSAVNKIFLKMISTRARSFNIAWFSIKHRVFWKISCYHNLFLSQGNPYGGILMSILYTLCPGKRVSYIRFLPYGVLSKRY